MPECKSGGLGDILGFPHLGGLAHHTDALTSSSSLLGFDSIPASSGSIVKI